jgi:hypothetical protein
MCFSFPNKRPHHSLSDLWFTNETASHGNAFLSEGNPEYLHQ